MTAEEQKTQEADAADVPAATASSLGVVTPDGTTTVVGSDGTLTAFGIIRVSE